MPFVVIYYANVLYPGTLRDVLIRVALMRLVQAKWTEEILDETFDNLKANRPDLDPDQLDRTRQLMCQAVPDCLVAGYEALIPVLTLPDPGDRHVLAAAIRAKAQMIVTTNLRDFPAAVMAEWDIEARHPDDFLLDQFYLAPAVLHRVVQSIADSWRRPSGTASDVIDRLERSGLPRLAMVLRARAMR